MKTYDVIVLGVGGCGSAALYHLAKRGVKALGIEQYSVAHDRGSSHGQTRIIRQAYYEHPDYVPLCLRAYRLWQDLEADSGESLLHRTGLIICGPEDGEAVPGTRLSAERHGLDVESVEPASFAKRFPGFALPEGHAAVYEREGGYLEVERCVRTHIEQARKLGAELKAGEQVIGWCLGDENIVQVSTNRGEYQAAALIVTAGPWAADWLDDLNIELTVLRKPVFWCPVRTTDYDVDRGAPGFLFEQPDGVFYGFPCLDQRTLKLAEHSGGQPVDDPAEVDRELHMSDVQRVRSFIDRCLPGVDPVPVEHSVCMYTMSPDQHFLVDRHPLHPNIVFAAGLSGHGFKFTGVLGEALADLATGQATQLPLDFLRVERLHRTDV